MIYILFYFTKSDGSSKRELRSTAQTWT